MNNLRNISLMLCAVLFLGACASTGNRALGKMDNQTISNKIIKNKTTKAEVKALLGQADDVDIMNNGDEKWIYTYKHSSSKVSNFIPVVSLFSQGTNDKTKKLVIVFNSRGVVKNRISTASTGESTVGIAG